MTTEKILAETLLMHVEGEICSKVSGRRNWILRVTHAYKYVDCGGAGRMKAKHMTSEFLKTIAERKIRWYEFTYKKDLLKAVEAFEKKGYKIYWA